MMVRCPRAAVIPLFILTVQATGQSALQAAVVAADNAADPAYAAEAGGAWKGSNPTAGENPPGSDDGGFGFEPWNFAGGFHYPEFSPYSNLNHFIDGLDFAHSSFNDLGAPAFGLTNANFAFGGSTARATRTLDSPLTVGSSIRVDFDNPVLTPFNQFAPSGFLIRLNAGGGPVTEAGVTERFGFFTTFGFNNGNWSVSDSVGFTNLGLPSTQTTSGARFHFTLTGSESYQLEILPLAGGAALASKAGSLANAGVGAIDAIEILIFENGSGNGLPGANAQPTGEREFFFNNFLVATAGQAGDYDADGDVDGNDFLVWQRTLGSTTNRAADGNHNGEVDAGDLEVWKSQFGSSAGAAPAATVAVPEPSALIFALVHAFAAAGPARRLNSPRSQSNAAAR